MKEHTNYPIPGTQSYRNAPRRTGDPRTAWSPPPDTVRGPRTFHHAWWNKDFITHRDAPRHTGDPLTAWGPAPGHSPGAEDVPPHPVVELRTAYSSSCRGYTSNHATDIQFPDDVNSSG